MSASCGIGRIRSDTCGAGLPAEQVGTPGVHAASGDAGSARARTGRLPVLVIPTRFADSPEDSVVEPDELQALLFDGPSPDGTLGEYFEEVSRGAFEVSGVVTPWVRTSVTVEADGDDALRRTEAEGGDRGVAGDVFAADGGSIAVTDATNPSTRDHLGGTSTLTIHSIGIEDDAARVVLSVGSGFRVASRSVPHEATATSSYTARLRIADGAGPFDARIAAGRLPEGLAVDLVGSDVVVAGSPLEVGRFEAAILISDSDGRRIGDAVRIEVRDAPLDAETLAAAVAGGAPDALTDARRRYLDRSGNRNGELDIGDLRAFLQRREVP